MDIAAARYTRPTYGYSRGTGWWVHCPSLCHRTFKLKGDAVRASKTYWRHCQQHRKEGHQI